MVGDHSAYEVGVQARSGRVPRGVEQGVPEVRQSRVELRSPPRDRDVTPVRGRGRVVQQFLDPCEQVGRHRVGAPGGGQLGGPSQVRGGALLELGIGGPSVVVPHRQVVCFRVRVHAEPLDELTDPAVQVGPLQGTRVVVQRDTYGLVAEPVAQGCRRVLLDQGRGRT